jgi:hypothetical protein
LLLLLLLLLLWAWVYGTGVWDGILTCAYAVGGMTWQLVLLVGMAWHDMGSVLRIGLRQIFAASGPREAFWHEFLLNLIATDVTLID